MNDAKSNKLKERYKLQHQEANRRVRTKQTNKHLWTISQERQRMQLEKGNKEKCEANIEEPLMHQSQTSKDGFLSEVEQDARCT